MTVKKPIQFRAVHTKTRWRPASHESLSNALGNRRGAKALFDHLTKAIDYEKHGEPLYVIVWDERQIGSGKIVKPDHSKWDGLQHASITDNEIHELESGNIYSNEEFEKFFTTLNQFQSKNSSPRITDSHSEILSDQKQPETERELELQLQMRIQDSRRMSQDARQDNLALSNTTPVKITVQTTAFIRNSDVIVDVLDRASGLCECCRKPAPFIRASDGTPYLEVHHIVPLSEGGSDTVENAQALCPN